MKTEIACYGTALASILLLPLSGPASDHSSTVSIKQAPPAQFVVAKVNGECMVDASWSGDLNGSIDWTPALFSAYEGFEIRGNEFRVAVGSFSLTARFDSLPVRQSGTYNGELTYLYVTDATKPGEKASYGFPMDTGMGMYRGVDVTLTLSQWDDSSIAGEIEVGEIKGRAIGPEAPRTGGPGSPTKTLSVTGKAQFRASGKINPSFGPTARCHNPYLSRS